MNNNSETDNLRELANNILDVSRQTFKDAESHLKNGNLEAVALLYESMIIHLPDNYLIHNNAAWSFQLCGDIDKSKFHYKKAYELNKDYVDYYS